MKDWKSAIPLTVGCLTIAGALIGGAKAVSGHFETRAHAMQQADDNERSRLELQLQLYELKLQQLRAKTVQTQEDARDAIRLLLHAAVTVGLGASGFKSTESKELLESSVQAMLLALRDQVRASRKEHAERN